MHKSLADTTLKTAKPKGKRYKLFDGGGLYLLVSPTGAKLWRYKYRIAKKEGTFAIGEYPAITLARARVELEKCRELVRQGIHPLHNRKREELQKSTDSANTFEAVGKEWIQVHQ